MEAVSWTRKEAGNLDAPITRQSEVRILFPQLNKGDRTQFDPRVIPNLAESQAVIFVDLYGDLQGFRDGILHAQMQQSGYAGLLRR